MHVHDTAVDHMHKAQSLRMNFWTPTFDSWGHGFNAADMPWYVLYDYVEVYNWDEATNGFKFHWRDDFDNFDASRWHKASGGFEANSSIFHPDNAYAKAGNLVLKMEPEPENSRLIHSTKRPSSAHDHEHMLHPRIMESLGKHFPRETLHAKTHAVDRYHYHGDQHHYHQHHQVADEIDIPPVHDAFVDSHLYSKKAALEKETEVHDVYHVTDEHGELSHVVDHQYGIHHPDPAISHTVSHTVQYHEAGWPKVVDSDHSDSDSDIEDHPVGYSASTHYAVHHTYDDDDKPEVVYEKPVILDDQGRVAGYGTPAAVTHHYTETSAPVALEHHEVVHHTAVPTRRYHVDSKYYSELNPIPDHNEQGGHGSEAQDHYREAERLQREAEREHRETEKLHHSYSNSEEILGEDVTVYAEPIVHHPFKHHKVHHHYHHDRYVPEPVISYDETPDHLLSYEEFKLRKHERQAFEHE